MQKKIKAIILGCGDRGLIYANYIKAHDNDVELVGIAEPIESRRNRIQKLHDIDDSVCVNSYEDILVMGKIADVAIISTQDKMHFIPTMKALELGYDVLLEKPMSPDIKECIAMIQQAKKYDRKLVICHVLRYTPFYTQVKNILGNGDIGDIISIQHNENVGYWHHAHSFVRGHWRDSQESSPMILAKSCHDLDLIQWLVEDQCKNISSFGSLKVFHSKNAPGGAAKRCVDACKARGNCAYDATQIYYRYLKMLTIDGNFAWPLNSLTSGNTREDVTKAIEEGPYGRCVYHCDNNVVDHQVVNLEYKNGVTVAFSMCAFTNFISRNTQIMGTLGELQCDTQTNKIIVRKFKSNDLTEYNPTIAETGHGGGDDGIFEDFIIYVRDNIKSTSITDAEISVASHVIALAAEESRVTEHVIAYDDFYNRNS
ncbi:MAG: Gfo/Idh/MocA family oxidoreductase [Oscillospiraceae bacterium]